VSSQISTGPKTHVGSLTTSIDIDNPIHWQAEPAFQVLMTEFLSMAKAARHDIHRMEKPSIKAESLVNRIAYKRERFPGIVESLFTIDKWDKVYGPQELFKH
jgi:hypothetical protein